jgi:hypothetical protein
MFIYISCISICTAPFFGTIHSWPGNLIPGLITFAFVPEKQALLVFSLVESLLNKRTMNSQLFLIEQATFVSFRRSLTNMVANDDSPATPPPPPLPPTSATTASGQR